MGLSVAELIYKVGITEQTCCWWKKHYAGLESDQAHEFKQVAEENARPKKLMAELSFDKAVLAHAYDRNQARLGNPRRAFVTGIPAQDERMIGEEGRERRAE